MYRCGTRGMAHIGIPDGDARVICDTCGLVIRATTKNGGPCAWLMNNKAPPGWTIERIEDGVNRHFCPRCKNTRTKTIDPSRKKAIKIGRGNKILKVKEIVEEEVILVKVDGTEISRKAVEEAE